MQALAARSYIPDQIAAWLSIAPKPPEIAAISAAGTGPFIMVGHSLGGLFVRDFAAQFPADTAAVVLVDSSHEDQLAAFSDDMVAEFRAFLRAPRDGLGDRHERHPCPISILAIAAHGVPLSALAIFWEPIAESPIGMTIPFSLLIHGSGIAAELVSLKSGYQEKTEAI